MTTPDVTPEEALEFLLEHSWDDITYMEDAENVYRALEGKEPPDKSGFLHQYWEGCR
jgi:hypothetical protein